MEGTLARARGAFRSFDFRRLFAIRMISQSADGLFQVALVSSVVFSPERHSTEAGFAIATLIVSAPYSVIGPFTGVFIDRWSRRAILVAAPCLRAALVWLVLFDPVDAPIAFYAGALWVLSVNRFYLATAVSVVPRMVPTEDLLIANSVATVGGTVALLLGVFVGGWVAYLAEEGPVVIAAGAMWLVASWVASRIRDPLLPHHPPEAHVDDQLRRIASEFADGARRLARTPRAVGPIVSITLDQMGQGIVLVLSLVVFREWFGEGVGSFSNLIGAGGVGVFAGILTVGKLEERFRKERIVAGAFLAGAAVLLVVSTHITGWSVLIASFFVGLTFAWKKIPIDTMVQESIPDGYRGRAFAVYDVAYNVSRIIAALLAIPLVPALGAAGTVALIGVLFLLWSPVLPLWIGRAPEIRLRFYEGAKAEEWPRAVVWGGVEERVDVRRSWVDERNGMRSRRFRLALEDGTVIDVSKTGDDGQWRLDRELSS
ncbi:MAG TPA: MFS transporter [Actinomycetota bacterium]|nr:MFS transporter [Actinomycetota bacterium]